MELADSETGRTEPEIISCLLKAGNRNVGGFIAVLNYAIVDVMEE